MKKIVSIITMTLLLVCGISFSALANKVEEKIILIDPGHGGYDGGARSQRGTVEKDINLSISLKLKDRLQKCGYKVYMTRDSDIALSDKKREDLEIRCKMKKDTKCDAFISIHQNKFPQENCFGAQVWYADSKKSEFLAKEIQSNIIETVKDNNKRLPKCAKKLYKILRDGYEEANLIVECGFISNPGEEKRLKTDEHQDKIVEGIVKGLDSYFRQSTDNNS